MPLRFPNLSTPSQRERNASGISLDWILDTAANVNTINSLVARELDLVKVGVAPGGVGAGGGIDGGDTFLLGDGELDVLGPGRGHQVLQLHGQESPERCAELKQRLGLPLWKALRIRSAADLERARAFEGVADGLLLDAWVADQLGGTGQAIPIDLLATFRPGLPWGLAGGIAAERVAPIWQRIQPDGLDASSAVERAPGDKILSRVAALVRAVEACRQP